MSLEYTSDNVTAPYKNSTTAGSQLACIWMADVDGTSDVTDLSTVFGQFSSGDWITIANDGDAKFYVALGPDSFGTIDPAATGVAAGVCWPVPANAQLPFRVQEGRHHLYYMTSAGTSTIRVYRSSTPENTQPSRAFRAVGQV